MKDPSLGNSEGGGDKATSFSMLRSVLLGADYSPGTIYTPAASLAVHAMLWQNF